MFRIAILAAAAALVACGGGGGAAPASAPVPVTNVSAEGIWNGTTSTGFSVFFVILENGESWGIYGLTSITGAFFGNASTNSSSISMNGTSFDFISRVGSPGTLTGTVVSKSTLNLVSPAGSTLNAAYSTSYDQTPSLAALAGTYSGQAVSGGTAPQATTVTISATGTVNAVVVGCATSGSVIPRATGKNIFNVSVTSVGPACALGTGTVSTGIAYFNPVTRQFIAMALNPSKGDGFVYTGTR